MQKRATVREWLCDAIVANSDFLDHLWFSHEERFLLSGHANSKNNVYWGTVMPEDLIQRPLHSTKCTPWIAISKNDIVGPYCFEHDRERPKTANTERYVQVLTKFGVSLQQYEGINQEEQWFQQDGSSTHQITT